MDVSLVNVGQGQEKKTMSPPISTLTNNNKIKKPGNKNGELVLSIKTVQDLRNAIHKHLHGLHSVVFKYEGNESEDDIIKELFEFEDQQNKNVNNLLLDDGVKKMLYAQLMNMKVKEHEADDDQECQDVIPTLKDNKNKPSFDSTEDLIRCLTDPDEQENVVDSNDQKSPFSELLEQTGIDLMEADPKDFDNMAFEEGTLVVDLDKVEGTDLLPVSKSSSSQSLMILTPSVPSLTREDEIIIIDDSEDDDSFHSAETTISVPDNTAKPSSSSDNKSEIDQPLKTAKITKRKKICDIILNPGMTDDEVFAASQLGIKPCWVHIKKEDIIKPEQGDCDEVLTEEFTQNENNNCDMHASIPVAEIENIDNYQNNGPLDIHEISLELEDALLGLIPSPYSSQLENQIEEEDESINITSTDTVMPEDNMMVAGMGIGDEVVVEVEVASTSFEADHQENLLSNTIDTIPSKFSAKAKDSDEEIKPNSSSSQRPGPNSRKRRVKSNKRGPGSINLSESESSPTNIKSRIMPNNKKQKVSVSSSSSGDEDAYIPLVVCSSPNPNKKNRKNESPKRKVSSNNNSPTIRNKSPVKKVVQKSILVDVDENESSSDDESNSDDSSESEEDFDYNAVLNTKPSEEKNLVKMKEECGNEKPNIDILKDLMGRTSNYRKRFFEADNYDIDHGRRTFTALNHFKILKYEYNELNPFKSGERNRMEKLEEALKDSLINALNIKKRPGQKRHGMWERALNKAKTDQNLSKGMKRVLGMICLCFHLAENDIPRNLLLVRNRGTPLEWKSISTPRLVMYEDEVQTECADEMWIYAEGMKHIQVPNVYQGVLTVYALHYVFSVEYLPSLRPLFQHFDSLAKIKT